MMLCLFYTCFNLLNKCEIIKQVMLFIYKMVMCAQEGSSAKNRLPDNGCLELD